jgi:hypothetical protein
VFTFISDDEKFVVQRYGNELGIEIKRRPIKTVAKGKKQ